MRVLLNSFVGALLLALALSSPAKAGMIIPKEHWDRCIDPLWVRDADLVAEMRRETPPLVTEANSRGAYYLDFSRVREGCGPWIWKVMGMPLEWALDNERSDWQVFLRKLFYHFRRGEIPWLDDYEAMRQEACPPLHDRRMHWPHGTRVIVDKDQDGNIIDEFYGAAGDPRCALLDEVDKGD